MAPDVTTVPKRNATDPPHTILHAMSQGTCSCKFQEVLTCVICGQALPPQRITYDTHVGVCFSELEARRAKRAQRAARIGQPQAAPSATKDDRCVVCALTTTTHYKGLSIHQSCLDSAYKRWNIEVRGHKGHYANGSYVNYSGTTVHKQRSFTYD
jgi:hypothetical protein